MTAAPVARPGALSLVAMLLRRLGLLVVVLGAVRYGLTFVHASMPHETVASIESGYAGHGVCVAQRLELFKILNAQRLRGMSEEEIRAEHARQCEGPNTVKGDIYLVLTWNDYAMAEHKTTVLVSSATAERLIERGRLRRDAVRIRYRSTSRDAPVVLMEEIEAARAESGLVMLAGGVLALVGFVVGLLRRKPS
jgi:hypothetical protein